MPEPAHLLCGLSCFYIFACMRIVFLDEFGHIGPFISRSDPKHKTSPVFGLSGFIMPDHQVRAFSTWFFKLKQAAFADDIANSARHPSAWEKKGREIFTRGRVYKTKRLGYSLINQIMAFNGKIFYHGIEKYEPPSQSHAEGLYSTVLAHALRALGRYAQYVDDNFIVILDEHPARLKLLESAMRTMFGEEPVLRLIQPPFQAESHLYQTIQAADWISSLIGPLWAHEVLPQEFPDYEWAKKYFGGRITSAATYSSVQKRRARQRPLPLSD